MFSPRVDSYMFFILKMCFIFTYEIRNSEQRISVLYQNNDDRPSYGNQKVN